MKQLFFGVMTLGFAACGSAPSEPAATPVDRAAILAAADAHDGTVDKVVSECAVCGLAMAGDPQHAVAVDGYAVHLCSSSCQTEFETNTDATLSQISHLTN